VLARAQRSAKRIAIAVAGSVGKGGFSACSPEEAFKHFPLKKRESYLKEWPKVEMGLSKADAFITAFVKYERLGEWDKDPRMIQFRCRSFSALLATYLKVIEHRLYVLKGDGGFLPPGRVIAKGLNQRERAKLVLNKLSRFNSPVVNCGDASRWDMHVRKEVLELEHSVYNYCFCDRILASILNWQLVNKGRTSTGVVYTCPGGRMSGDMNTALGNCLLAVIIIATALEGEKWDLVDDGDDFFVINEEEDNLRIRAKISQTFAGLGFKLKLEDSVREFGKIIFCQSQIVHDGVGFKFVRSPMKILGFGVSGSKFAKQGEKAFRVHLRAVGLCELALNVGVPIVQEWAVALLRMAGKVRTTEGALINLGRFAMAKREVHAGSLMDLACVEPRPITIEARVSFAEAFGISIGEQEYWEDWCRSMSLPVFTKDVIPDLRI